MIGVLLAGAVTGVGLLVVVLLVLQTTTSGPVALAQFDSRMARGRRQQALTVDRRHETEDPRLRKLGSEISDFLARQGRPLPKTLTSGLALAGMSREVFLARTVLFGLLGLFLPSLTLLPLTLTGTISFATPLWLSMFGAFALALLPASEVRRKAAERRQAFRHVVSSFLDLVAMNLAGGRGVPEALQAASGISDSWALVRIRDTLQQARLQGATPWAALGELGDEVDIDELRDLSAALALVAEDGAKVRDSLSARAASMRRRELADAEGRAAAKSQSMLVAQLFLCFGFLLFLIYPSVARIVGS